MVLVRVTIGDEQQFADDPFGDEPVETECVPDAEVTRDLFLQWRSPREGTRNPERLDNPVWQWLVRSRLSAYEANARFAGPHSPEVGAAWSCLRFGQSRTRLPDGRWVGIAGEHEDSYDADFHIYNDVIVRCPDGAIEIFGYPHAVFPPTDFHSATLIGDRIVVIGCLGYPEQRQPPFPPVFVLDTGSWSFDRVTATGEPPGWIHKHDAVLTDGGSAIVVRGGLIDRRDGDLVENLEDWRLDLSSRRWQRITSRDWQQWLIRRQDGKMPNLFEFSSAVWTRDQLQSCRDAVDRASWQERLQKEVTRLAAAIGGPPDLDLARRIFQPGIPHEVVPEGDEYDVHRCRVDGVTIRIVEAHSGVRLIVEGALPQATIDTIVGELRTKLATLERCEYTERRV